MRILKLSFLAVVAILMSACAALPYEEDFACTRNPTYGKCVSVEGAYEEAVTGVSQGHTIYKEGINESKDRKLAKKSKKAEQSKPVAPSEEVAYSNYRTELYTQLEQLTAAPKTPVVQRAIERRTLILSYSPTSQRDRLYMPRYVYSIHQPAQFVLGQYRLENDPSLRDISDFLQSKPETTNTGDKQ